jgi:hypothetical protein
MDDDDGYFGEGVAARYDESYADMFDSSVVDAVVEVLAGLAPAGRALELGMGTGRIALPGPPRTPFAADLPRPPNLLKRPDPSVGASEGSHPGE